MEKDISKIIEEQASGIVKALGMPEVRTTTYEKEVNKNKKNKVFKTKVFVLIDDISAEEYAAFMNYLIANNKTTELIREVENWTKDGELVRVVDYIEEEPS